MKNIEKAIKGLIIAGALVVTGTTFAATQGTLGTDSTGTVDIIVGVGDQIQISGLSDITGAYVPGSNFIGSTTACVYRNGGGAGAFDVTITSANGLGALYRLNDAGTFVNYTVTFSDSLSGAVPMANATLDNTNFTNANTVSPTCAGAPQSTLAINILDADLTAVPSGTYTDTLTILVAPR